MNEVKEKDDRSELIRALQIYAKGHCYCCGYALAGPFSYGCTVALCNAHVLPVAVPHSVWHERRERMKAILKEGK